MNIKLLNCCSIVLFAILLSGCGTMFEKEYVSVSEYKPAQYEDGAATGKVTVKNFAGLKQALLNFAYAGESEGSIVFDQSYEGDTTEDVASACWQVRTQDALCAYCVDNIAYELNKIVTINEANVYISYSNYGVSPEDIVHLSYSSGIKDMLKESMDSGQRYVVALVNRSSYDAEQIESTVTEVYRENPSLTPKAPTASVNMYSGTGSQRLYEISFFYGMTNEEMQQKRAQLHAVNAFGDLDTEDMSEGRRALEAFNYLSENCSVSTVETDNTAYAALINRQATSEGIAFAYVELCRQLQLDCRIVYGQRSWEDYCWNIVKVDGDYYHVDVTAGIHSGPENSFLLRDESAWGDYRWDVASYPKCAGELKYGDVDDQ